MEKKEKKQDYKNNQRYAIDYVFFFKALTRSMCHYIDKAQSFREKNCSNNHHDYFKKMTRGSTERTLAIGGLP